MAPNPGESRPHPAMARKAGAILSVAFDFSFNGTCQPNHRWPNGIAVAVPKKGDAIEALGALDTAELRASSAVSAVSAVTNAPVLLPTEVLY